LKSGGALQVISWREYLSNFSLAVLQIPANFWYTDRWVADLPIKKGMQRIVPRFGPWAQATSIVFSVVFTVYMMLALWTCHV
jgi:hypothetical protein